MFEEGLEKYLASQSKVNTILGTNRGDGTNGVFALIAPKQPTYPYIIYEQTGTETFESLQGVNKLQGTHYRFKCYAADYPTAARLCHAVLMVLNGLITTFQDADATQVQYAAKTNEGGLPVERELRSTTWGRYVDFHFLFIDSTP